MFENCGLNPSERKDLELLPRSVSCEPDCHISTDWIATLKAWDELQCKCTTPIVLYPVHYIADSNVWYFSEFGTWLEIWTSKIKMSIPNKEKGFNCGRKWSKSGLKLTQLKTGQTICPPCRHNEGKHCTHGAHCVETLFWYVWGRHDVMFYFFIDENRFRYYHLWNTFPTLCVSETHYRLSAMCVHATWSKGSVKRSSGPSQLTKQSSSDIHIHKCPLPTVHIWVSLHAQILRWDEE